jgi:GntR family transcriptional regulator, transcriptional repressor for pyruvate dehydrogenase complex
MVFSRVKPDSLVENVVNQIEQSIVDGFFKPGEKLPHVRELQESLGTSRGTMREALRILGQKGLIEVRKGTKGGVFVREATTEPLAQGLALLIRQRRISVDDLAEFRQVIESGLIRLVSKKIKKKDINELKKILAQFKTCVAKGAEGWPDFLDAEVNLRKTLIRMTGNPMYEAVLFPIHENIFAYAYHVPGRDAEIEEAYTDWCNIVAALVSNDAERAALITREHIARYAARIKNNMEQATHRQRSGRCRTGPAHRTASGSG